ncbi:MAG: hypothetical protein ACXADS_13200 [Candidatus Thorarchaeota archaeon]
MIPASPEGESVVDCYDQTTLEVFASSTDPAVATTVETPSAAERTGSLSTAKQREEAQFRKRGNAPMKSSKGQVTAEGASRLLIGDNSRDKGGTQKSEVKEISSIYRTSSKSEGIRSGSHMLDFPSEFSNGLVGSRRKS